MPTMDVLDINHRVLIASSKRKAKFFFLRLPDELQDQIVSGMDRAQLTLAQAEALLREKGFTLSVEAISGYYMAVRRRRAELLAARVEHGAN